MADIGALYTALAAAQAEVESATKGSVNPHLKNRYADLGSVLEAAKPVLAKHGLCIVTLPSTGETGGDAAFTTTLSHTSGAFITESFTIPYGAKRDAQGLGGALTYARRYCLSAWLNMWAEDDDGETAVGRPGLPSAGTKPAAPAQPAKSAKELIEELLNAPTIATLNNLQPECVPYRGTPEWPSIEAAAKSRKAGLTETKK